MDVQKRYEAIKKLKMCYSCLDGKHLIKDCKANRICGVGDCSKKHNRMLHPEEQKTKPKEESSAVANVAHASGILQLVPVTVTNGNKSVDTLALCDTGSTVSFIDSSLTPMLKLRGAKTTLSVAGINGTSELQSEKFTVSISATNQDSSEQHEVVFYEHPNIYMGSAEYYVPKLKR